MEDSRWTTTRTAPERGRPLSGGPSSALDALLDGADLSAVSPALGAAVASPAPRALGLRREAAGDVPAAAAPAPWSSRWPRSAPPARGSRASTARGPSRAPKRRRSSGRATTPPGSRRGDARAESRPPNARAARRASPGEVANPREDDRDRPTPLPPLPPLPPPRLSPSAPRSRRSRRPRGRRDRPTPPPPGTPPPSRFSSAHLRSRASAGSGGLARTSGRRRSIARFDTDSTRGVGTTRWRRPRRSAPGGAEAGTLPRSSPRGRRGFGRRARRRTRWRRSERPGREGPERAAKNPTKTTRPGRERRATGRRGTVLVGLSELNRLSPRARRRADR